MLIFPEPQGGKYEWRKSLFFSILIVQCFSLESQLFCFLLGFQSCVNYHTLIDSKA